TPQATRRTSTSPALGSPSSTVCTTSGAPNCSRTAAFISITPLILRVVGRQGTRCARPNYVVVSRALVLVAILGTIGLAVLAVRLAEPAESAPATVRLSVSSPLPAWVAP